jgi:hypothetical protein
MKTAMQELWDYVKEDKENINFIVYGKLRNKIIPLIEKEKEQIINAVVWFDDSDRKPNKIEIEVKKYYKKTYKN